MRTTSGSKQHHWKLIADRKNRMQVAFESSTNKRKFTPLRDNSMRDSSIFQRSRQRSNSSMIGLNKTRDGDNQSVKQKKQQKMTQSIKPIHRQTSVLISTIKNSEFKGNQSLVLGKQQNSGMNLVLQIQKQFKSFKDKIFKQLQRQQQVINTLAKQILATFQFQLSKLKEQKIGNCSHCSIPSLRSGQQSSKFQQKKVKQIQQIKQQLNKRIQTLQQPKGSTKIDNLARVKSAKKILLVNNQSIKNRFDNFFDIFSKLKQDMNEIQMISGNQMKSGNISTVTSPVNSPRNNTGVLSRKMSKK